MPAFSICAQKAERLHCARGRDRMRSCGRVLFCASETRKAGLVPAVSFSLQKPKPARPIQRRDDRDADATRCGQSRLSALHPAHPATGACLRPACPLPRAIPHRRAPTQSGLRPRFLPCIPLPCRGPDPRSESCASPRSARRRASALKDSTHGVSTRMSLTACRLPWCRRRRAFTSAGLTPALMTLFLSGCAAVVAYTAPPPARVDVVPTPRAYAWLSGHWKRLRRG